MSTTTVYRTLPHNLPAVWEALSDTAGIHRFHPLIERSPLRKGSPATGVGSERTCYFYDGNHIAERVTGSDPLRSIEVEIVEGSMPLRCARARFDLEAGPAASTRVRMTMTYEPKFGVLGRLMDSLVMRRKFTGMMTLLVEALDEHLRTGETIERGFSPARAA